MKTIKKILPFTMGATILFNVGSFISKYHAPENTKIEVASKKLVLNDRDLISLVSHKDEKSGVEDIREFGKFSPYEECFAYFPDIKKWQEIGVKRAIAKNKLADMVSKVSLDTKFLKKKVEENPEIKDIIIYHNHPSFKNLKKELEKIEPISNAKFEKLIGYSSFPREYFEKGSMISKENKSCEKSLNYERTQAVLFDFFYTSNFNEAKPSIRDLKSMVYESLEFPNHNIRSKICSEKGITEFYLTKKGIEHYKLVKEDDFLKEVDGYTFSKDYLSIENEYMIISFKSHDDLRKSED